MFGIRNMNAIAEAGLVIRAARRAKGMTQAELARKLKMGRSSISLIENGLIEEIGVRKYALLCEVLGLSIKVVPHLPPPTLEELVTAKLAAQRTAREQADATVFAAAQSNARA